MSSAVGTSMTGGCQCGAVRYRLDAAPDGAVICHCRMCQKASGGAFTTFCGLPEASLKLTKGAITLFRSSDTAERGFCARCGTPLTYKVIGSQRIGITIGSLDDPNAVAPQKQLGTESRVAWLFAALEAPELSLDSWLQSRGVANVGSRQHPDREVASSGPAT